MPKLRVGRRTIETSNLDKPLFPEDGITKGELIDYYRAIARRMLTEMRDRLLTMERFPDGIHKERFFQKGISKYFPDWIDRMTVPKKGGTVTHVVVREQATLVYLANQAMITPHMSLSRSDRIDHPDQMIFDLDPSVDDFALVRQTALEFKDLLDDLGLSSVVKTTGSRGLHVTVPLNRKDPYEDVRAFARDVAVLMATTRPDVLTVEHAKVERGRRIFLDWMRNNKAQTAVAPFGVRARPSAPVAMPISWEEVSDASLTPARYTIRNAVEVAEAGDPWAGWRRKARSLEQPRRRLDRAL